MTHERVVAVKDRLRDALGRAAKVFVSQGLGSTQSSLALILQ